MKRFSILSIAVALMSFCLSLTAHAECPDATTAQGVDYYLSNPYLFQCTTLKDTVAHDENVKYNKAGLIKITGDGWSDFHWDGVSACVFDNINLSKAGKYYLTINLRGSATDAYYVVNGVQTAFVAANEAYTVLVNLNAGMNEIQVGKGCWFGVYSIELKPYCALPAVAQAPDYYLDNPYLFECTDLKDTVAHSENVKYNKAGLIKITEDGWSDFHWDGVSACVFDNINMSKAGKYKLTINLRGNATDAYYTVNGVQTSFVAADAAYETVINLNAGMNEIWVGKGCWFGVYSIELESYCPAPAVAQAPDYYLDNPYLFECTDLKDTVAHSENVKYNKAGLIKITEDGWSDFHWDGVSACVFDNINMSKAGKYKLTINLRGSATDAYYIVNGDTTAFVAANAPYSKVIDLKAGMNEIQVGKGCWFGVYSIELASICGPKEDAAAADYYLDNTYYFQCTDLKDTVAHDEAVKYNKVGLIKITEDGWSDYHWDGPSACVFDNINMSEAGNYMLTVNLRGSATDAMLVVNGDSTAFVAANAPYKQNIALKAGMNEIWVCKGCWFGVYSIDLATNFIPDTTLITFDKKGGEGGSDNVKAIKGQDMPEITLPTKTDFFFDGYEDAAGVEYYDENGESVKAWDKSDATATLYAKWYDGAPEVEIDIECPDKAAAAADDYYLDNMYYALCTSWKPMTTTDPQTGRKDLVYDGGAVVLMNNDSNMFKLCSDKKYVDWHWDDAYGKSSMIFDNINLSKAGNYDISWYQRNGGKVDVIVNGDSLGVYNAGKNDTLVIYKVALNAGANTIRITKNNNWPQTLGIKLAKSSEVVYTTEITLDMQSGKGGTTSVTATKGENMPEITIPTRDGYYFEGYFTEIKGGDQYYYPDGTSFKAWDKEDETFTLYAHWNDGGTGGDCPSVAQATSEDWFLNHMYDARCTELTNTWELDNGAYKYLNAEGEIVKITASGEWLDFYWADPSSIVFDSIYVSKDMIVDMEWYFRCDNIDGDPLDGSTSQIWVNDELFCSHTVWQSMVEGLDTTKIEGIELYADWPNKIKILKGNGWPLTRGMKLIGEATGLNETAAANFFIVVRDGKIEINRLAGTSKIAIYTMTGVKMYETVTKEASYVIGMQPGAYLVNVNGVVKKAIVR